MHPKRQQLTPRNDKEKPDKVKVILRVRPFVATEDPEQFISPQPNQSISINKPGMTSFMKFSFVQHLSHHSEIGESQKEIFSQVEEAVKCIFEGVDSTIFAYGQTGAGKTYTIIGNCPENNSDNDFYKTTLCSIERGILPRALEMIFEEQKKKKNSRITISLFEIYNQKIFDLLTSGMKPLEIRESKSGEIGIIGLSVIEVISIKEAINYLAEGIKNRATSSTNVNIKSSRSHSIFHVKYQKLVMNPDTKEHEVVVANLRVVDLAGSQKFNISADLPQAQKDLRLLQLKSINGSLSKLGHCISSLSIQSRTHIPVRDSKLTRILSESLLGSGKIRLIICVSPSASSSNETSSTLQFADRVKKAVFEKPAVAHSQQKKKYIQIEEYLSLQEQLEKERKKRSELQKMISEMKLQPGEMRLLRQNENLKKEIVGLKQQLKVYNNQDKLHISGIRQRQVPSVSPLPHYERKSLSPKYDHNDRSSIIPPRTAYQHFAPKMKSITLLKQDNSIHIKIASTPKKGGPMSIKDSQSKSQRLSVDEVQYKKPSKKGSKQPKFQTKIRQFMDKPEYDSELEQKVKKRLLEIKQEISRGTCEWQQSQEMVDQQLWK